MIVALVGTNIGWLIYETQYETSYTTQTVDMDTEGSGINNYVGNNDINNGKDNQELALSMAYLWLNDEDAKEGKLYNYYKNIPKRD